jgi:sulfatase modifying factor 1
MGNLKIYGFLIIVLLSCGRKSPQTMRDAEATQTILVKGGKFSTFGDSLFTVTIPDLEVMKYEVTNQSFNVFVNVTNYKTTAEKNGEAMVFDRKEKKWILVKGANWKNPQGPGSNIQQNQAHPVVQISQEDACAYCEWLNMRLPTEVEREYIYQMDMQSPAKSKNTWQGIFPNEDKGEDGFKGSSPVGFFGAGGSGCYDIQGNVWERCSDFYHDNWPAMGREMNDSIRYYGPPSSFSEANIYDTLTVIKGGSFLCAENYCRGYDQYSRMSADPKLGYEHVGFRCVRERK